MRQENPEKFHEVMQNKMKKVQEMKQQNPERYQQFMKNHPKIAQKVEHHEERQAKRETRAQATSGATGDGQS